MAYPTCRSEEATVRLPVDTPAFRDQPAVVHTWASAPTTRTRMLRNPLGTGCIVRSGDAPGVGQPELGRHAGESAAHGAAKRCTCGSGRRDDSSAQPSRSLSLYCATEDRASAVET